MTHYLDLTKVEGCIGLLPENGDTIVLTGVSVSSMPLSVKRREGEIYDNFARMYGVEFIFDDCIPVIDFYTVPRIDIAATDRDGGFIASVGEAFDLRHGVPLVYIAKDRTVFLITEDSTSFLSIASEWKNHLTPYPGLTIYDSIDEAKKEYTIIEFEKTAQYQKLMQLRDHQTTMDKRDAE